MLRSLSWASAAAGHSGETLRSLWFSLFPQVNRLYVTGVRPFNGRHLRLRNNGGNLPNPEDIFHQDLIFSPNARWGHQMRRRLLFATIVFSVTGVIMAAFAAAATWENWGRYALAFEVGAYVVALVGALMCGAVLAGVGYIKEAAQDKIGLRIADAMLADPFLRDLVVRRLSDTLSACSRTPPRRKPAQARQGMQTKPFEAVVTRIGAGR